MNDIYDIKLPAEAQVSWWPIYFVVGVIIVCVFLFLVFILYKKVQKAVVEEPLPKEPEPEIDYKAEALKKLEKIKHYINEKMFEEFFVELSFIVKEYLGGIHKKNAIEMTSFEIIRAFQAQELKDFFEICYRHEFAGIEAKKNDANRAFKIARSIIEK